MSLLLLVFMPWLGNMPGFLSPGRTAIGGALLVLAQALILGRRYPRGLLWVPANAVGLAGAVFITQRLVGLLPEFCQDSSNSVAFNGNCRVVVLTVAAVASSALFSIITGTTLVWITRRAGSTSTPLSQRYLAGTATVTGLLLLGSALVVWFSVLP